MTKKITKSFRLSPSTVVTLDELVKYYQKENHVTKVTATDVIDLLIKKELDRLSKKTT